MSIAITNNVGWKYLNRGPLANGMHAAVTFLDQHRIQDINFWALSATIPTGFCLGMTVCVNDDNFGYREYIFLRNQTGVACVAGTSYTFGTVKAAAAVVTAGTVTSLTDAGIAWTPGEHVGRLLRIIDDVGAAGAAPECETVPIIGNTVETLFVNPATPFTAAPAAGDTYQIICPFRINTLAAAGDTKWDSIAMAMAATANNGYGWFVVKAELVLHNITTAALTQDLEVEMAANGVLQDQAAAATVGTAATAVAADAVLMQGLIRKFGY